jgi:hypothetical protein
MLSQLKRKWDVVLTHLALLIVVIGFTSCGFAEDGGSPLVERSAITSDTDVDTTPTVQTSPMEDAIDNEPTETSRDSLTGSLIVQSVDQRLYVIQNKSGELQIDPLGDNVVAYSVSPNLGHLAVLFKVNDQHELLLWDMQTGEQKRYSQKLPEIDSNNKWALAWMNPTTLLLLNGEPLDLGLDVHETFYWSTKDSDFVRLEYPIDIVARCFVVEEVEAQDLDVWCSIRELDDESYYVLESDGARLIENQSPPSILHRIFGNERGAWSRDMAKYVYPKWQDEEQEMILMEYNTDEQELKTVFQGKTHDYGQIQWSTDGKLVLYSGSGSDCTESVVVCWSIVDTASGNVVWNSSELDKSFHSATWAPNANIVALADIEDDEGSKITFYEINQSSPIDNVKVDFPVSRLVAWAAGNANER